jgi:dihydroorotate dehydrogenase
MLYTFIRNSLFLLDGERAHGLTLRALTMLPSGSPAWADPALAVRLGGLDFPGPVGLAAGFDKDGLVAHKMHRFGFGFAELGTLTPLPQEGNPRPRLFRLREDRAVINRMGFNNQGQGAAALRIARMPRKGRIIGINIGANKDSPDRIADYVRGVEAMAPLADYLTVNISSPNTPGLRALQDKAALDDLLGAVMTARQGGNKHPPIFLKVAPDLQPGDVTDIAQSCAEHHIDALIISNTTISRPPLSSHYAGEAGGLSGEPLHDLALDTLRAFRRELGGTVPLIGAGGISNADQAYSRICAGASLIQLYSALVYEGPFLAERINAGLKTLMQRDGFTHITQAVGSEAASD